MSEEEEILLEKLAFLRKEKVINANPQQIFELNKRIEEIEKRLKEIRNQSSSTNEEKVTKMTETNPNEPPKTKKWKWYYFLIAIPPVLLAIYPFVKPFIEEGSEDKKEEKIPIKLDCPQKTINAKVIFEGSQENASNVQVEIVEMMGKNERTDSEGNVKFEIDKPYDANSYTFKITCPECETTTLEKYIDTTKCAYRIRENLEVKEKPTTSSTTTTPQKTSSNNSGNNSQNSVSFGGDNNGTVISGNDNVEINNTKPKNEAIK